MESDERSHSGGAQSAEQAFPFTVGGCVKEERSDESGSSGLIGFILMVGNRFPTHPHIEMDCQ